MCGSEHHHVLVMIEGAQRAGRTEAEIIRLVEAEIGEAANHEPIVADEHRLIRRLLARKRLPNAA